MNSQEVAAPTFVAAPAPAAAPAPLPAAAPPLPQKSCDNTVLWIALIIMTVMYLAYRLNINVYVTRVENWLNKYKKERKFIPPAY